MTASPEFSKHGRRGRVAWNSLELQSPELHAREASRLGSANNAGGRDCSSSRSSGGATCHNAIVGLMLCSGEAGQLTRAGPVLGDGGGDLVVDAGRHLLRESIRSEGEGLKVAHVCQQQQFPCLDMLHQLHTIFQLKNATQVSLAGICLQHLGTFLDWYWGTEEERYSGKSFFFPFFLSYVFTVA